MDTPSLLGGRVGAWQQACGSRSCHNLGSMPEADLAISRTRLPAVVHPDFLDRTIGHFYNRADDSSSSSSNVQQAAAPAGDIEQGQPPVGGSASTGPAVQQGGPRWWAPWRRRVQSSSPSSVDGKEVEGYEASGGSKAEAKGEEGGGDGGKQLQKGQWLPKSKAAFIQTPQDFFNVDASDPVRLPAALWTIMGALSSCRYLCQAVGPVTRRLFAAHSSSSPSTSPQSPTADGALRPLLLRAHAARPGRHRRRALLRHGGGVPPRRAGVHWRAELRLHH